MQKSDWIINLEHVSKYFGDKAVLSDINLYVRKGEFITILAPSGCGKTTLLLTGTVTSCIFKGVHYEMLVQTTEGYELMVQDYHNFDAGTEVGLLVKPFDIHVMKKERTTNTFEGHLIDPGHVRFLGCTFECQTPTTCGTTATT